MPLRPAGFWSSMFGWPGRPPIRRWRSWIAQVHQQSSRLRDLNDQKLHNQALELRYRAKQGEPLVRLLPEAYALVTEAAHRTLGMRHFDVQYLGGIAMQSGCIAEMETGEGKTFTATLPLVLYALAGKGAHLATANDYLAQRDADLMRPVYNLLGLTCGSVVAQMPPPLRRAAYGSDITYGTAKEFGFDFLRDRMALRSQIEGQIDPMASMLGHTAHMEQDKRVQRGLFFCLIDEADNVLIDEARTPLIISAAGNLDRATAELCYRWAVAHAAKFIEQEHFEYDPKTRMVALTAGGRQLARSLPVDPRMQKVGQALLYDYIERGVKVERDFVRDRQYIVRDGEIVIVDEYTGRLSEGRKWSGGLHQAIEAREGVEITAPNNQAAQITIQELFQLYRHLGGMTGTAANSAREFRKVYGLQVVPIPTHRPNQRLRLPDHVCGTTEEKWLAIVDEVSRYRDKGRAVLIGTRSIDKSAELSRYLQDAGIPHEVLNAVHLAREAEIVSRAGEPGRVTVATNMAGRGTDISLAVAVSEAGGLHVIASEMHDSARIDRQLAGRCARQGDPGSFRQYMALDDDILRDAFGAEEGERLKKIGREPHRALDRYAKLFQEAQQKIETKHFKQRRVLMHLVKQRTQLQKRMGQDPFLDTVGE